MSVMATDRVPSFGSRASALRQQTVDERLCPGADTREGEDPPEARDWTWPDQPRGVAV